MSNNISKKFMDRMFRRVACLVWDLSTGKLGIQEPSGIFTLEVTPAVADAPASYGINVNPIENFGFPIPAFATQVAQENIQIGDLVVGDKGILGWVIDKTAASLKLLDKSGMTKNYTPPKVAIMGGNGTLVVQSLGNLAGGEGFGALQGGLMPLLMMGGDNFDLESIIPLMLLTQTQGAAAGAAGNTAMTSMLPMLMMLGKKGGSKVGGSSIEDLLPMMMFGGLGGGAAGGMNPMMMAMMMNRGNEAPALEQISRPVRTAPALQPLGGNW